MLYKHGPYSFEVETELEQMQSYGAIAVELNGDGYGVVLRPDDMASFVQTLETLSPEERQGIDAVCKFVGSRNVTDLERLATASWIRRQEGVTQPPEVARRLHSLKPHVSIEEAERADVIASEWLNRDN